jgi:hypothetical protein
MMSFEAIVKDIELKGRLGSGKYKISLELMFEKAEEILSSNGAKSAYYSSLIEFLSDNMYVCMTDTLITKAKA